MHTPRKRFGQHFLCDQRIIQHIVDVLSPQKNEHLIEIGPGQGALTLPVIKQAGDLEAVELDEDLIPALQARAQHAGRLQVYHADVLRFDFAANKKDDRLLRLFGNLPYNISTPLIFYLIQYAPLIDDMLFMLQKEVAERLAAPANSAHYGRLSVMAQYHWEVTLLFDVSPSAFFPSPNVISSIVRFTPHRELPCVATNYSLFAAIVKAAFGQRRKTLRNSLKHWVSDEAWESMPIRSDARAENISVREFVEISNYLQE